MSKAKITKPKVVQVFHPLSKDSEEDSDSSVPIVAPKVNKKQKVEEKKVAKKQPVPASDSEEDSPVVEKKPTKQVKADTEAKKPIVKAKAVKEPSSDSDLSEEEAPKKVVPKAKSPVQKPVVAKKKVVVPEPEADSESEEEAPKPKAKVAQKVAQKVASPAQKPVAKKAVKPVEPASDSEEEQPVKKAQSPVVKAKSPQQKPLAKPAAKPVEEDEEGEFEVIVKGLSFQAYDSDVKDFFDQCGNVTNVKLLTRDDGKSKGLAFIRFSKKSSFNKAIALDGAEHLGRNLKIEEALKKNNDGQQRGFDNARPSNAGKFAPQGEANIETNTLFIGGLSFNSTVDSISEFFAQAGEVTSARIATDRETGKVFLPSFSPAASATSNSRTLRPPRRPTPASTEDTSTADRSDWTALPSETSPPADRAASEAEEDSAEEEVSAEAAGAASADLPATPETQLLSSPRTTRTQRRELLAPSLARR